MSFYKENVRVEILQLISKHLGYKDHKNLVKSAQEYSNWVLAGYSSGEVYNRYDCLAVVIQRGMVNGKHETILERAQHLYQFVATGKIPQEDTDGEA